MEYKEITIKLPIIKVKQNADIYSFDWAKENTPEGMYIIDNGILRFLCFRHLDYAPNCMELPTDIYDYAITNEAKQSALEKILAVFDSRFNEIREISNKTQLAIDETSHLREESLVAIDKATTHILTALENAKAVGQSGAASPLEIAKALAVIQQPELIKEIR